MFPAARFLRQRREINRVLGAGEMEGGVDEERATDGLMGTKSEGGCRRSERGEKAESTRERLKATSGERCAALGQWMGGRGR
jgi:hypothetical protein